jgi:hypothetical protein
MTTKIKDFKRWKITVDAAMRKNYGIDSEDAGIDDERLKSHWAAGDAPKRFVQWFGDKYDLLSKRDMGIEW